MNSILNTNLELFKKRFPSLYEITCHENSKDIILTQAKNGLITASYKGIFFHSKYDPLSEAVKLIQDFDEKNFTTALFLGSGLLYAAEEFCKKYPDLQIIIVESNPSFFFSALSSRPLEKLLMHKKLAVILTENFKEAEGALKSFNAGQIKIYSFKNIVSANETWYTKISESIKKSVEREKVNVKTLEKFSSLWLKNSCKNLRKSFELDGINKFMNLAEDIPFTVISAGPSLERLLPYIKEIKEKSIIVCVDTALHALLAKGVEPDFIVLSDPQYLCFLHLEFLKAPSSILITESAVYPSVLRFDCKEIVLCSSNFPMGQYFESFLGEKGKLGAGGSVSTVAWDFARFCGAKKIYMAAMDLGFPGKETHIKGSQFEEKAHMFSKRTNTAETFSTNYIMSAPLKKGLNYDNKELLTDLRMTIFSSWFESSCNNALLKGQKTFSLTSESLAIDGIEKSDIKDFLKEKNLNEKRDDFFKKAQKKSIEIKEKIKSKSKKDFDEVLLMFKSHLNFLLENALQALKLCKNAINDLKKHKKIDSEKVFLRLEDIDKKILTSSAKNAAALVFPTKEELEKLCTNLSSDKELYQFEYSSIVYDCIKKASSSYLELLKNC